MKALQKKSKIDLLKDLRGKQAELQRFRFGMTGSKTRDVKRGRTLRREVARIFTELNARQKENHNQ